MSLIKCPECGKDVSTAAEACPHCGYPIKILSNELISTKNEVVPNNSTPPLEPSWLNSYKSEPAVYKTILTFIFFLNAILTIVLLVCGLYIAGAVFGFICIFTFSFWLAGLICIKTKIVEEDGYHAIAIAGVFRNSLVVENVVQEIGHNRHLDGRFPNGKYVWADFAVWDSNIKISVDTIPFSERRQKR